MPDATVGVACSIGGNADDPSGLCRMLRSARLVASAVTPMTQFHGDFYSDPDPDFIAISSMILILRFV
jgi:hypothetical protein